MGSGGEKSKRIGRSNSLFVQIEVRMDNAVSRPRPEPCVVGAPVYPSVASRVSIVSFLHVGSGEQEGGREPTGGRRIMLDCKFEMCARFPPFSFSSSQFVSFVSECRADVQCRGVRRRSNIGRDSERARRPFALLLRPKRRDRHRSRESVPHAIPFHWPFLIAALLPLPISDRFSTMFHLRSRRDRSRPRERGRCDMPSSPHRSQ